MSDAHLKCCNCNFQSLKLRILLRHIYHSHSQELNFRTNCPCNDCYAVFNKHNSLYKHVIRNHKELFNEQRQQQQVNIQNNNVDNADDNLLQGSSEQGDGESFNDNTSIDHTCNEDSSSSASDEDIYTLPSVSDDDNNIDDDEEESINNANLNGEDFEHLVTDADVTRACASFILKVRDKHNISQVALESIMQSTKHLTDVVVSLLGQKVKEILPSDTFEEIKDLFENETALFNGLQTLPLQKKYLEENYDLLPFDELSLGKKMKYIKKGNKRIISEASDTYIYIPIIESLRQILSSSKIRNVLFCDNFSSCEGVYYDICDGTIYKDNEYFKVYKNALAIIIYHDDVEICNALGSKSGKHKLDLYYYTIVNLPPQYRSRHAAVRLIAIAKTKHVKEYGVNKILRTLVDDLITLYDGVKLNYGLNSITIYGKVVACTGDTLGQHLWAGFKEGVGASFQRCRHCYCNFDSMQKHFSEEEFTKRTKDSYERESTLIDDTEDNDTKEFLKTLYGINYKSILTELPGFDIINQLPQDIMHTIAEGVFHYEGSLILRYFNNGNDITLDQINGCIESHNYGHAEISDKPPPLKETFFNPNNECKLKCSVSQSRLFLRLLPFFLYPYVEKNDLVYQFLIDPVNLVQRLYTPVIRDESLNEMKRMIRDHLQMFTELFPDKNIIPKQHYLVHVPSMISRLGPPVRTSCYSFEAAHKYFKRIAQKQNFKNICLSLMKRYQRLVCMEFDLDNNSFVNPPLLSSALKCGVIKSISEEEKNRIVALLPQTEIRSVSKLSWVSLFGTKYTKDSFLIISASENPITPHFGKIEVVWLIDGIVYFELCSVDTIKFEDNLQAYLFQESLCNDLSMLRYDKIVDYNVIFPKELNGLNYLQPKYFLDDILKEHLLNRNQLFMNK